MQNKIWTVSNILSFTRILMVIPVWYFLVTPVPFHRETTVLIMLLAATTDALDGYFARVFHQETVVGKIIDPLADKIGVGTVVVLLAIFGDIPMWFMLLTLLRDIAIFAGGIYVRRQKGTVLPSLVVGKIAVSLLALTLVVAILKYQNLDWLLQTLLWLTSLLLFISFAVYTKRFFETIMQK